MAYVKAAKSGWQWQITSIMFEYWRDDNTGRRISIVPYTAPR
jgi:hypothetical protein